MKPALALLSLAAFPLCADGAVLYSTNFDGDPVGTGAPAGWTEPTGAALSSIVGATDRKYEMATANNSSLGLVNVGGVPTATGQGFTVTTQFSLSNVGGQYANTGIVFLADSTGGTQYRVVYNAGSANGGLLEFQNSGDAYATSNNMSAAAAGAGAVYTLTLTGTYLSGGALSLTATLTNNLNANTATSTATTDTTPLTGTYYGLRAASGGTGTPSVTSTFENFAVESIPEPSFAALLAAGAAFAGVRRRR